MSDARQKRIRNFSIIAHIDHGKSTLADRIIEMTGTLTDREMQSQVLDSMDLEKERGITIKSQAVRMVYKANDGNEYILNLIDTPGHVDFNYEVSRSLAACEGAILVIDCAQGIEAQTLSNVYLALEHDLEILPVINKIDLPNARPDAVKQEVEEIIGIDGDDCPLVSAKEGVGIEEVLERLISDVPPPSEVEEAPLKALIFDSFYDSYKGVVVYVRIKEGSVSVGDEIKMMAADKSYEVNEVGYFKPGGFITYDTLKAGEVGYIIASIKTVGDTRVGDTITTVKNPAKEPVPGYKPVKPVVFCGIYPSDGSKYQALRTALEKLQLNDASLSFDPETSAALGFGFRCGFLGLLHMEIIQERIEREYDIDIVITAPSVIYKVAQTNGDIIEVDNPTELPPSQQIDYMEEPVVKASFIVPSDFVGTIMELCEERRGEYKDMSYIDTTRVMLTYELPLNEIIYDFFDALKSKTRGYASFDYELIGYKQSNLVKLDILINGEVVDALSFIVHKDKAYYKARRMAEKLQEAIPRQLFEIPIQAAIGNKVIARETVKAMKKDVLSKCYGGDVSRKRKLLEKQKEGKKRMRQVGKVEIPQEAFMSVLKMD